MAARTLELTLRTLSPKKVTFAEFLDRCDEDAWAEWVEGAIIMTSSASLSHQEIGSWIEKVLGIYVEAQGLGKVVRAVCYAPAGASARART